MSEQILYSGCPCIDLAGVEWLAQHLINIPGGTGLAAVAT